MGRPRKGWTAIGLSRTEKPLEPSPCFYHPSRPPIGTVVKCGKIVCESCAKRLNGTEYAITPKP